MKIAIIGAGAIGGYVGVKLALAGEDVTFIVRGANLEAIKNNGMKLIMEDGTEHVAKNVKATNSYDEAGPQDMVILALKAHQVDAVAEDVPKLFGPDTVVVTMQNGIPFWYFHKHGGPHEGKRVQSVDPTGLISAKIPADRILGCVVYRIDRSWRRPAHRGRPFPDRRTRRKHHRAGPESVRSLHQRRLQIADSGKHPFGNLVKAVGQPHLQPHQLPVALHIGRHLPIPVIERAGRRHDDRSPENRQQTRHRIPCSTGKENPWS